MEIKLGLPEPWDYSARKEGYRVKGILVYRKRVSEMGWLSSLKDVRNNQNADTLRN